MAWFPPDDYIPIRGVATYLLNREGNAPSSGERKLRDMIIQRKSPYDVDLSVQMARKLIDQRIVTTGLYPSVLAIALRMTDNK